MRKAQFPDIHLAPQVLLACDTTNKGCEGGDARSAYQWIYNNNITDETCSPFQGKGHTNGLTCNAEMKCRNCKPWTTCWAQERSKIYGLKEFGNLQGEQQMMNELFQRGPITCGVAVTSQFMNYTKGIFQGQSDNSTINHDISVVGW
jgi:cathepsin X